jgi:hypothetical protein
MLVSAADGRSFRCLAGAAPSRPPLRSTLRLPTTGTRTKAAPAGQAAAAPPSSAKVSLPHANMGALLREPPPQQVNAGEAA